MIVPVCDWLLSSSIRNDHCRDRGQAAAKGVANSARTSEASHREKLERQAEQLTWKCTIRGYGVVKLVKEVGSGVIDGRLKLLSLTRDPSITRVNVVQKDRLTHFGFRFIEML